MSRDDDKAMRKMIVDGINAREKAAWATVERVLAEDAAAPQAPSGQLAEPSDEQLDALMPDPEEKGEPWRDEYGYEKWDYNFNKAQVRQAMRAAIASQQSERPAPAGQAVGDMTDTRLMRIASEQSVSFEVAMRPIVRTWGTELRGFLNAALAASQAERPASLHSWLTNFREAEKREPTPVEIWCAAIDCVSPPAPAGQAVGEEKATRAQIIEWLDALDIEVTDKQLNGLFLAALAASQAK